MIAKIAFAFPHSNKSGTRINSKMFIVAMTNIWVTAFSRVHILLKIQIAIKISESPIKSVKGLE